VGGDSGGGGKDIPFRTACCCRKIEAN